MKGAQSIPKPKFLLDFIAGLDSLAKHNFPVEQVLSYLKATPFQEEMLEPYTFFSEKRYTRNLLHKMPGYEVLLLCWMPNQVSPIHGHVVAKTSAHAKIPSILKCWWGIF